MKLDEFLQRGSSPAAAFLLYPHPYISHQFSFPQQSSHHHSRVPFVISLKCTLSWPPPSRQSANASTGSVFLAYARTFDLMLIPHTLSLLEQGHYLTWFQKLLAISILFVLLSGNIVDFKIALASFSTPLHFCRRRHRSGKGTQSPAKAIIEMNLESDTVSCSPSIINALYWLYSLFRLLSALENHKEKVNKVSPRSERGKEYNFNPFYHTLFPWTFSSGCCESHRPPLLIHWTICRLESFFNSPRTTQDEHNRRTVFRICKSTSAAHSESAPFPTQSDLMRFFPRKAFDHSFSSTTIKRKTTSRLSKISQL